MQNLDKEELQANINGLAGMVVVNRIFLGLTIIAVVMVIQKLSQVDKRLSNVDGIRF